MEERTKKEGTERHSGPFQGAITAGGYVFLQQLPGPKDPLAIFFFFFFFAMPNGMRILVPPLGIKPAPPALEAQRLNH